MNARERTLKEIGDLQEDAKKLFLYFDKDKKKSGGFAFRTDYQHWYTRALKVVQILAPDRYEEFRGYYEPNPKRKLINYATYVIQDYLKGIDLNNYNHSDLDRDFYTAQCILNQVTIINSITTRIDSTLANLQSDLLAELQDAELNTARQLLKISPRAAGALAGVVLEGYLQKVAIQRGVTIAKKAPTIADLNDPLKQAEVYDQPTWRKISWMADIRNLCSHKKTGDPTTELVTELIEGVNWTIKNVS